jgi:hypothetical protein
MKQKLTKKDLKAFLKGHQAIKVAIFLKECTLGRNYLNYKTKSDTIEPVHRAKILPVMEKYGFNTEGHAK